MEKNWMNTFEYLVDMVKYREKKYAEKNEELENLKSFRPGFFSPDKKKLKAKKQKLEKELEQLRKDCDSTNSLIKESTTFEREDLSYFIAEYFSLIYGKKYEVQYDVSDNSESKYAVSCDLIASSSDFEAIDKMYDLEEPVNINDVLDMCKDNCITLGGSRNHTLLEDSKMNSEFCDFPELISVAKRLVEAKLSNDRLTDKQRLDLVLKDVELEKEQELEYEMECQLRKELEQQINDERLNSQPSFQVSRDNEEPKISILRREGQQVSSAQREEVPKIEILGRTDSPDVSQIIRESRPVEMYDTRYFQPFKPSVLVPTAETKIIEPRQSRSVSQTEIDRKILDTLRQNAQSVVSQDSIVSRTSLTESIPTSEPSSSKCKKLSKSMMGIYMNRR